MHALVTTRATAAMAAFAVIVAGLVVTSAPAYAATPIQVTSFVDDVIDCDSEVLTAPVTLRSAVCVANNLGGEQLITLPAGAYELTPAQGALVVGTQSGSNITIDAPDGMAAISGDGTHRVMTLDPAMVGGVTVQLSNLTITGGVDNTHGGGGIIAGSYNATNPDTLIITDSVFTNNLANTDAENATNRPGGAIQFIGGTLTVQNSQFSQNSSGSSPGGAIAYQAIGASGQGLTIAGSAFSANTTRSVGVLPNGGAAVVVDDSGGSAVLAISGSSFTGNTATGTSAADAHGAAIWHRGGSLSLEESTFTGNRLAGGTTAAGTAVHVEVDASLSAHYNRVVGNPGGHGLFASTVAERTAPVDATNNWWGCAAGPGTAGCATVAAADYAPWLTLTVTADLVDVPVDVETTVVTASLLQNSAGEPVPAERLSEFDGLPVAWSDPLPSDASISPESMVLSGGTATAVFAKNSAKGAASITATLDNAAVVGRLGILYPPTFTSGNAFEFTVGQEDSSTVMTDAYHLADIAINELQPRGVPDGLAFQPNADGTATISGTPADGTGGLYAGALSATNSVSPDASQNFTLEIFEAPEFTSADATVMTVDEAATFTVVTDAHPVAAITATGLPAGLNLDDEGDGTAVISGTVTEPGSGGIHPIILTASNGVGGTVTQELALTLNEAPTVTLDPMPGTVNATTTATFTAGAAIGYPAPSIQWEQSSDGGATFTPLLGETATELSFTAQQSQDGYRYRAVFSNSTRTATTAEALLTVGTPPVFSGAASTVFMAEGGLQSFTVETYAVPHATISISGDKPAWLSLGASADGRAILTGAPSRGSGGEYVFTLTAGNSYDPDATRAFTLSVHEAPSLEATASAEFTVGTAGSTTISADPTGYPLPTEITVSGALPAGLALTDGGDGTAVIAGTPELATGGVYTVTVAATNDLGSSTQTLTITVAEAPVITLQPVQQRLVADEEATFTAQADGHPAPAVQWQVSTDGGTDFTDLEGATSTTLTVNADQSRNGYRYRAMFSSTSGTVPTDAALLTVGTPPKITSDNEATFIALAADQQFSVTSSGVPAGSFSLQSTALTWLTLTDHGNGTATLAGTPPDGVGGEHAFTITVDNDFGAPDVQAFTLTVAQSPSFTSGSSASFGVDAFGSFAVTTAPGHPADTDLSLSGELPDGVEFAVDGLGGGTLSGTAQPGSGGVYSLVFTAANAVAPATTQLFELTITENPVITTHPSDVTASAGNPVVFTAAAIGHPAPTVQWQQSTDDGATFTDLVGENATMLTFTAVQADNGTQYRAMFGDGSVSVPTNAAVLTVGTSPSFSSAATATFIVGEGAASATVTTDGIPDASLSTEGVLPDWLSFTDNHDGTGTLSGEPVAGSGGEHVFTLLAGNGYDPEAVQAFTLVVHEAPTLDDTGAATFGVLTGGSVTVQTTTGYPVATLTASGSMPSGVSFTDNLDGTATISGTPGAATGGAYPLVITADNGVDASATQAFALVVTQPVAVTAHPGDLRVSAGTTITFTAAATGYPSPSVQWQVSDDSGASYADAPGATSATLTFTAVQEHDGTLYRAVFTGTGSGTTAPAVLTVGTPAQITSVDRLAFSAAGGVQSATLTASGLPVADIQLSGAPAWLSLVDHGDGTATLTGNPSLFDAGAHPVTITASNTFGAVAVQILTVHVTASATITSAPGAAFSAGSASTFTITASGGHPAVHTITAAGALPPGVSLVDLGDGTAVISGTVPVGNAGLFPLTITASNGQATDATQSFVLTVNGPPVITSPDRVEFIHAVAGEFTAAAGHGHPGSVSLSVSGTLPTGLAFVDNGDGTGTISGTASEPAGSSVDLTVTAQNSVGAGPAQTLTVDIVPAPVVTLPPLAPLSDGMLQGTSTSAQPGQSITVTGAGFAPHAPVTIGIYSTPQVLAVVPADATGAFTATITLPRLTGSHMLVAAGLAADGEPRYLTASVFLSSALPVTGGGDVAPATTTGTLLLLGGFVLLVLARVCRFSLSRRNRLVRDDLNPSAK